MLTHAPTFGSTPETGLWVEVSGALTVAAAGHLDVSGRGFRGDCASGHDACGAGARWLGNATGGSRQFSGGSYGGLGGGPQPNAIYGDALETWLLGAGGGYGNGGGEHGGSGGGRIRLIVQSLVLQGEVRADGQSGAGANAGGGAGGGIWITASQLSGTGLISAKGGDGIAPGGGGGGGGRVHIDAPGDSGSVDVDGGGSADPAREGGDGTSVRD